MILTRTKRLLTNKEFEEWSSLINTPAKQKKYLEKLKEELFEEYEYKRKRND